MHHAYDMRFSEYLHYSYFSVLTVTTEIFYSCFVLVISHMAGPTATSIHLFIHKILFITNLFEMFISYIKSFFKNTDSFLYIIFWNDISFWQISLNCMHIIQ